MELKTAIEILDYYQEWRLGKREDMIHEPKKTTQALDIVLSEVKKIHTLTDKYKIMSKEQNLEDKDKALHIGRVIISLPFSERIELIYNAIEKSTEKRKEQGFAMTYTKRKMYEMGFKDAIEWILSNEL